MLGHVLLRRADDPPPNARDLLKSVRVAQSSQNWKLSGRLRVGSRKLPFRLTLERAVIRYEFPDTGDTITEHFQQNQVVWNGNGGRVYFYQSELPYDPPSQAAWNSPTGTLRGWAAGAWPG